MKIKTRDYYFDKEMDCYEGYIDNHEAENLKVQGQYSCLGYFTKLLAASLARLKNGETIHIRVELIDEYEK